MLARAVCPISCCHWLEPLPVPIARLANYIKNLVGRKPVLHGAGSMQHATLRHATPRPGLLTFPVSLRCPSPLRGQAERTS